jgi:carbonic anhydrase
MFPAQLEAGYRAFLDDRFVRERRRYESAAAGQSPETMVIGCCDSRVSPDAIFDASPGEIFVARNIANLVPPYERAGQYHGTSSAIEFAVQQLKVKHIVVLGHARCGGIQAAASETAPLSPGDFIGQWMSLIAPAVARVAAEGGQTDLRRLEFAGIELSLANLMTFPFVRTRVERGELQLHGAYFGVANGILLVRDPKTGAFERLVQPPPSR